MNIASLRMAKPIGFILGKICKYLANKQISHSGADLGEKSWANGRIGRLR